MEVLQFLAVAFGSYVFGIIVMMIIRANTMEENECVTLGTVSYTHLDVYKRQQQVRLIRWLPQMQKNLLKQRAQK